MTTVRKKQMIMSRAMAMRKMKLEKVSKPSQVDNEARGSGKIAIRRKTIGNNNQAIELLIEMVFLFRDIIMMINNNMAAIDISI